MGIGLTADGVTGASQGAMSCQQGQETRSVIERIPYYQLARVAGPQLMVGNVFVVKHASIVPQSALAFARILEEASAPKGALHQHLREHRSGRPADRGANRQIAAVMRGGRDRIGQAPTGTIP
jgi:hypothetical protein